MDVVERFNESPLVQLLGIELREAADGHAEGRLQFSDELRSDPNGRVAHGGATYALADTVGGAAVVSMAEDVTPTVDMRIDYLAPVTGDVYASADVLRFGASIAMVRVEVDDGEGTTVATATGTYKTGGQGGETPWLSQPAERDD
jgi:uncharacterized protein (TIGR00369 family)